MGFKASKKGKIGEEDWLPKRGGQRYIEGKPSSEGVFLKSLGKKGRKSLNETVWGSTREE